MGKVDKQLQAVNDAIKALQKVEDSGIKVHKGAIASLEKLSNKIEKEKKENIEPWEVVQLARKVERPRGRFYLKHLTDTFIECHGDRQFGDDPAIIGGIATIGKHVVTLIVFDRGQNTKESITAHFGMPHPEGYRKALRLMKQAEKFNRPVVCLIDTPGAYCGIGAEERGQGEAISRNLLEMSHLKTPIIAGIIGEGGSGGALALAVADKLFMQENSVFSILSPEGFASILWKDAGKAAEAASQMKMVANDLLAFGMIDDIVEEPAGGAHEAPELAVQLVKEYIIDQLEKVTKSSIDTLLQERYERFRRIGRNIE